MKNYYTRSDLAIESLAHAVKDQDYKHHEERMGEVTIETFEILKTSDLYPHERGKYIEISFADYTYVRYYIITSKISLYINER